MVPCVCVKGEEEREAKLLGVEKSGKEKLGDSLKKESVKSPSWNSGMEQRNIGQADGKKEKGCARGAICHGPDETRVPCDTVMDGRTDRWTDGASPMDTLWTVLRRTFEGRLLVKKKKKNIKDIESIY